jgi:hypothetical protein
VRSHPAAVDEEKRAHTVEEGEDQAARETGQGLIDESQVTS